MAYKWDSSLESGYEKVDNQHKQLVAMLNDLMEAIAGGKGDEAVLSALDFLTGYVIKHFADEEKLQLQFDYPDYFNHKTIHDDFKKVVDGFMQQVRREGPTEEIINEVSSVAGEWLLHHIKGDDFRMATFVKAADEKQAGGK